MDRTRSCLLLVGILLLEIPVNAHEARAAERPCYPHDLRLGDVLEPREPASRAPLQSQEHADRIEQLNSEWLKRRLRQWPNEVQPAPAEWLRTQKMVRAATALETCASAFAVSQREREKPFERLRSFAASGTTLRLEGGYTDVDDRIAGPVLTPTELDRSEWVSKIRFGWISKKILRDAAALLDPHFRVEYAASGAISWQRRVLWDAVRLDLTYGYGSRLDDPDGPDNSEIEYGSNFQALLRWDIRLDVLKGTDW